MKVSVLQENLYQALAITERFVSTKSQLPVLSNLLFEAKRGAFLITATNLDTGIRFRVGAKVEKEGSVTVPARVMGEFVGSLEPGKIELSLEGEMLRVVSGKFRATFQIISAEEFPEFPGKVKGAAGSVDRKILEEIVEKVGFSASSDESRPVLTGVLWDLAKTAKAVATDGYRLSLLKLGKGEIDGFGEEKVGLLLPASVLREIEKVFSEIGEEKVVLSWSEEQRQMFFSAGDAEIVTRLLEGEFPDYKAIVPQESGFEVVMNRRGLLQAVKAAAIFARESANIVRWKFTTKGLEVSANSPQVGENVTLVEVEKKNGEGGVIAFNSRYLLDFLTHVGVEKVRFSMTDSLKPGILKEEEEGERFLYVIMPVRVQEE